MGECRNFHGFSLEATHTFLVLSAGSCLGRHLVDNPVEDMILLLRRVLANRTYMPVVGCIELPFGALGMACSRNYLPLLQICNLSGALSILECGSTFAEIILPCARLGAGGFGALYRSSLVNMGECRNFHGFSLEGALTFLMLSTRSRLGRLLVDNPGEFMVLLFHRLLTNWAFMPVAGCIELPFGVLSMTCSRNYLPLLQICNLSGALSILECDSAIAEIILLCTGGGTSGRDFLYQSNLVDMGCSRNFYGFSLEATHTFLVLSAGSCLGRLLVDKPDEVMVLLFHRLLTNCAFMPVTGCIELPFGALGMTCCRNYLPLLQICNLFGALSILECGFTFAEIILLCARLGAGSFGALY